MMFKIQQYSCQNFCSLYMTFLHTLCSSLCTDGRKQQHVHTVIQNELTSVHSLHDHCGTKGLLTVTGCDQGVAVVAVSSSCSG